jgi:hypothetical protein
MAFYSKRILDSSQASSTPQTDASPDLPSNTLTSTKSQSSSHLRSLKIRLSKTDGKQLYFKINSVDNKQDIEVECLTKDEKKKLRATVLNEAFFKDFTPKRLLKFDLSKIRKQIYEIFMGDVPDELTQIIGVMQPVITTDMPVEPNFYNERVD